MTTKILPSMCTFGGDVVWRKIATMSAYTFDVEVDLDLYERWNKAHPMKFFRTASVEKTDTNGIFHVWLPLLEDNRNWKPKEDKYRRGKVPDVYPNCYDENALNHWLNFAEPFLIEKFV